MQDRLDEIKRLAEQQQDLVTIYQRTLESLASGTEALAAVAWDCTAQPYQPICQFHPDTDKPVRVGISRQRHAEILQSALQQPRPILAPSFDGSSKDPTPVIAVGSIRRNGSQDLVEVFLKPKQPDEFYQRCLTQIENYCTTLSETLVPPPLPETPQTAAQPQLAAANVTPPAEPPAADIDQIVITGAQLDNFVDQIHRSIELPTASYSIANQLQALLSCDRVSVIQLVRGQCKTIAVSGLPKVNRRANTIRALERLAKVVLKTRKTFWYPDDAPILPQIQRPLNDYLTLGVTRSLAIIPVLQRYEEDELSPERRQKMRPNPVIGGIAVEHFSRQWTTDSVREPIESVSRHAAAALRNASEHRRLFLYPVWHLIGKTRVLTYARNLPKTIAVLLALIIIIGALCLVPADYYVTGNGELVPKTRQNVFAQVDGDIEQILVEEGQMVEQGEILVKMSNSQLDMQLGDVENQIAVTTRQIESLDAQRLAPDNVLSPQAIVDSDLQRALLDKKLKSLLEQRGILQVQFDRLSVRSPIDGQIVSWDIDQQLRDRPVMRGERLLEVADTEGEWEILLNLPDRRIGHLQRAQRELGEDLKVTFILAADPDQRFEGTVESIALATQVTQDAGHSLRVRVKMDRDDIDIEQIRTDVVARIYCHESTLGYVWLSDLFEFAQSKVLFYLW